MDETSVSLLRRVRDPSSQAAWERFVALYAPLVYRWGRSEGLGEADSADLVQEVLAVLLVKLPDFHYDPSRSFRAWLRTVAVNKARDLRRRLSARPAVGLDHAEQAGAECSATLFDEAEYRQFIVGRALELMQSEFREDTWKACWKYVVEGRRASDVASELGITPNAVYVAKFRVIRRLREELAGLVD